ncbi:MAG: tyrosine-type recombinase/integrase [Bacteroidota bacterium]|nr:tyrosine-type recombinase/integrase [Bacteroidota bacterium]
MQPTDFSICLTNFLTKYLPAERGASKNTITAYRDTFVLLIHYMESTGIKVTKLTLNKLDRSAILGFLTWVQKVRNGTDRTRNLRLAAVHSFFKYLQYHCPEGLQGYQEVLGIPMKKAGQTTMTYLSIEGITLLLQQPDAKTSNGRRDLALLSLMYDTGARVQEIIDLTPSCVRLDNPSTIKVTGKGNKARIIPMLNGQTKLLKSYMDEQKLNTPGTNMRPLFFNSRSEKLTRAGVNYILAKYVMMAREKTPNLMPIQISCHSLRHSKAMHLLQAGVNLVYIRDILGHVSVTTTEIYARVDSRKKREAIEAAYVETAPKETASWLKNGNLLEWLNGL